MLPEKFTLSLLDYFIIGIAFVISSAIGLFFQFCTKKKSNVDYLMANKNMSLTPVVVSLMATLLSATAIMGVPAEIYLFGISLAFTNIGFVIGVIISAYVFLPVYFSNDISTVYEYLEKRFGKTIRRFESIVFTIQFGLSTSVTLFGPALALNAVTDLSVWVSIISIGLVCTFYCTLGGMKAVLWADLFQAILMYVCLAAIIIKGCIDFGSIANVFHIAKEGGRIFLPNVSMDIDTQYTLFNIFSQGLILATAAYGAGQIQVQRLRTLKNLSRSRKAAFWSIPLIVLFSLMCCFCGLIFYAYFVDCDPLQAPNKPIHSPDQLMPYFIIRAFHDFPGLPGLCIAGVFSASLSTISSALNSLAAVTVNDFIHPIWPKYSENVLITKFISFAYGVLAIAFSFLLSNIGNLFKITTILHGMICGPNLGVFILATCTKATNEQGALLGMIAGLAVAAFLSFMPTGTRSPFLPLSKECHEFEIPNSNITTSASIFYSQYNLTREILQHNNSSMEIPLKSGIPVSYMWISTIAMFTCIFIGYFVSIILTFLQGKSYEVPDIYLSPVRTFFSKKSTPEKNEALPENVSISKAQNSFPSVNCEEKAS